MRWVASRLGLVVATVMAVGARGPGVRDVVATAVVVVVGVVGKNGLGDTMTSIPIVVTIFVLGSGECWGIKAKRSPKGWHHGRGTRMGGHVGSVVVRLYDDVIWSCGYCSLFFGKGCIARRWGDQENSDGSNEWVRDTLFSSFVL